MMIRSCTMCLPDTPILDLGAVFVHSGLLHSLAAQSELVNKNQCFPSLQERVRLHSDDRTVGCLRGALGPLGLRDPVDRTRFGDPPCSYILLPNGLGKSWEIMAQAVLSLSAVLQARDAVCSASLGSVGPWHRLGKFRRFREFLLSGLVEKSASINQPAAIGQFSLVVAIMPMMQTVAAQLKPYCGDIPHIAWHFDASFWGFQEHRTLQPGAGLCAITFFCFGTSESESPNPWCSFTHPSKHCFKVQGNASHVRKLLLL